MWKDSGHKGHPVVAETSRKASPSRPLSLEGIPRWLIGLIAGGAGKPSLKYVGSPENADGGKKVISLGQDEGSLKEDKNGIVGSLFNGEGSLET